MHHLSLRKVCSKKIPARLRFDARAHRDALGRYGARLSCEIVDDKLIHGLNGDSRHGGYGSLFAYSTILLNLLDIQSEFDPIKYHRGLDGCHTNGVPGNHNDMIRSWNLFQMLRIHRRVLVVLSLIPLVYRCEVEDPIALPGLYIIGGR